MTIKELAPHISCVCYEEDFEEAKQRYSEIFVVTLNGIFKYVKLKYDRFISLKVKEVPGHQSEFKEDLHFLPSGKIPFILFKQIIAFFRKVIEVKKSKVEAHIHILWNPSIGYYLSVPNQRVSGASVTYDFSHIGKDDIIVADFHSHQDMGAFYSGTDENDDKNKTYYTGVIGKISQPTPEYVLRFNYNDVKHNCDLNELFEITQEEVEVPESWLERIHENKHYSKHKFTGFGNGKRFDPDDDDLYTGLGHGYGRGGSAESLDDLVRNRYLGKPLALVKTESQAGANQENKHSNHQKNSQGENAENSESFSSQEIYQSIQELEFNPKTGTMVPKKDLEEERASYRNPSSSIKNAVVIGIGKNDPSYLDYLTAQYGSEVADGYDQVTAGLTELDGCDEILLDVIREAYSLLTTNGQLDLAQKGM